MSGALAAHRTPNRPLFDEDGEPVYKRDKYGHVVMRSVSRPGGLYKDGRCVEWISTFEPVQRHVLDYTPQRHRPSKNAGGRTKPRTPGQAARIRRLNGRMAQLQKSYQLDVIRMAEAVGG